MEKRPSAVVALDAAKIDGQLLLNPIVYLAEIVIEHYIFGRNCRIGLKFKYPMPVFSLALL